MRFQAPQRAGAPEMGSVTIAGPYQPTGRGDTPSRARIFVCRPASATDEEPCARKILAGLSHRAFRRPVSETDVKPLVAFYRQARAEGADFDGGIGNALQAMLVSPDFLFRFERDRKGVAPGSPQRLSDHEMASRLSFFLWSSIPDDELLAAADQAVAGRVGNPGQADYAMANETLESVAQHEAKQRPSAIVRVLHWGPWDGGMVTPSLRAVFIERGVALIPISLGARLFESAITNPGAPVSVVVGGRPDASVLLGPGGGRRVMGDLVISSVSYPHLSSHAVKGVPVFPVALALEAFARIARSARPDLRLAALKDLRVLKGIRVDDFEGRGTRLEISCEQIANGSGAQLSCELRSRGGPAHYRAIAEMTDRNTPNPSPSGVEAAPSGAPWSNDEFYGPVLFHGPQFQVLKGVPSVGPQGGWAVVASTQDIGWIGGPYATDPAAVDGGLQMAILMGMRALGKTSLPTGVEALTLFMDGPLKGPFHCSIKSRSVSDLKTVSDAIVRTEDGRAVCELRGIEMHVVDTTAKA